MMLDNGDAGLDQSGVNLCKPLLAFSAQEFPVSTEIKHEGRT